MIILSCILLGILHLIFANCIAFILHDGSQEVKLSTIFLSHLWPVFLIAIILMILIYPGVTLKDKND